MSGTKQMHCVMFPRCGGPPVCTACGSIAAARLYETKPAEPINPRLGKRIVAAAIMLNDGTIVCGVRHFDKLMHDMIEIVAASRSDRHTIVTARRVVEGKVEGFIANDYQFYGREESWIIAVAANQFDVSKCTGTRGVLYSEDLW